MRSCSTLTSGALKVYGNRGEMASRWVDVINVVYDPLSLLLMELILAA